MIYAFFLLYCYIISFFLLFIFIFSPLFFPLPALCCQEFSQFQLLPTSFWGLRSKGTFPKENTERGGFVRLGWVRKKYEGRRVFLPSLPPFFSPFYIQREFPAGAFSWLEDKRAGPISVIRKKKEGHGKKKKRRKKKGEKKGKRKG